MIFYDVMREERDITWREMSCHYNRLDLKYFIFHYLTNAQ